MAHTLSGIAAYLGLPFHLSQGADADVEITGVNTLEESGPADLSFLANPKYAHLLTSTKAAAVIVRPEDAPKVRRAIVTPDPYLAFAHTLALFDTPQGSFTGISPLACIDPTATLGANCTVYPFAYIGPHVQIGENCTIFPHCYIGENTVLGANCVLYPHVTIMARITLGKNCVVKPGAVLGGDGFGFVRVGENMQRIPQLGTVVLGDNVHVGSNTSIDRAALSQTIIGNNTCLDNLVQVGHNVRIGKNSLIISQVGISGSTIVGDNVTLAGQVGVSGHLHIGDNVTIGPQSGVVRDIEANQTVGGNPPVPQRDFLRTLTLMPRFPELFTRLSKVEKTLAKLMEEAPDVPDVAGMPDRPSKVDKADKTENSAEK